MNRRTALLPLALAGCALTRNAPPLDVHYFSPEPPAAVAAAAPVPATPGARLRLGRIRRGDHLRYRIVQRTSPVELRLYESRRWSEQPDDYVRRALADALFEQRPLVQALGGPCATLDVEVVAFEEVLAPHRGRVQLHYVLHDRGTVLAAGRVRAERPVHGDDFAAVVTAISLAMVQATADVADAAAAALGAQ